MDARLTDVVNRAGMMAPLIAIIAALLIFVAFLIYGRVKEKRIHKDVVIIATIAAVAISGVGLAITGGNPVVERHRIYEGAIKTVSEDVVLPAGPGTWSHGVVASVDLWNGPIYILSGGEDESMELKSKLEGQNAALDCQLIYRGQRRGSFWGCKVLNMEPYSPELATFKRQFDEMKETVE